MPEKACIRCVINLTHDSHPASADDAKAAVLNTIIILSSVKTLTSIVNPQILHLHMIRNLVSEAIDLLAGTTGCPHG